jgi:RNA-directed DNA polymerase
MGLILWLNRMKMKRANGLMALATDPENLRLAFWKAQKGKSFSRGVNNYRAGLEENLGDLRKQMSSGLVEVGSYRFFKVFDPKERQICAAAFGEQVLHHALMNICHDHFERVQIFDSYACRKGKGTYAALERAKLFSRKSEWFLKLDVRKYFDSIHHEVLKVLLAKLFKDQRVMDVFGKIIDSYAAGPGKGLPIGNLTSQYFANHYLSGLDHFVKEQLGIKGYVRYMDDMVLWHDDRQVLKKARTAIREYLRDELKCELKPELLNRVKRGMPFLGYLIFPHHVWLSRRSKLRFIRKWKELDAHYHSGEWSEAVCQRHALPLIAFTAFADAKKFRENVFLKI